MTLFARQIGLAGLAALGAWALLLGAGCSHDTGVPVLSVDELGLMLEVPESRPVVYDANSEAVRAKYGILPGARLLSSSTGYDPSSELSPDRSRAQVFYCSNAMCSAAPMAARRAMEAGYGTVYVLPAGIKGWAAAGRAVARLER